MSDFSKIKSSSIDLNIQIDQIEEPQQRTEEWQRQRLGRWTGSQMKALMSSSRSVARMSWAEPERIYTFGDTALKYIYENAMQRKTGRYIDMGQGTTAMRYGTAVEPLIVKLISKKIKKQGLKYEPVGFKTYQDIETAGVSADGIIKRKDKLVSAVEIKACTNWQTHYDRTFELTNEKSIDFWQMQAEMFAWNVQQCYYYVAEPVHNIGDYVYYDGDIMDLYKKFKKETNVSLQIVEASEIHQNALIKRIKVAERALTTFLSDGGDLRKILHTVIDFYKN